MTHDGETDAGLDEVLRLVGERAGLSFRADQRAAVEQQIRREMEQAGLDHPAAYVALLQRNAEALDELLTELTVGETYFFRDPAQWEYMRTEILPALRRQRGEGHVIRAWSAACASGEEPYSLAVICHEAGLARRSHILATDISRRDLTTARNAKYRDWSLRGEGASRMAPYLKRIAGESGDRLKDRNPPVEYELDERIRRLVHFEYLNLALDVYPSTITGTRELDLILCRNVLIYFDRVTVAEVARRLLESLAPGGWLITAASDPSLASLVPFEVVATRQGVFYRRAVEPKGPAQIGADVETRLPGHGCLGQPTADTSTTGSARRSPALPPAEKRPTERTPRETGAPLAEARRELLAGNYVRAAELTAAWMSEPAACVIHVEALANLDPARATDVCQQAATQHPLSAELHYLHGVLLMEANRHQDAVQALRRVLYLDRSLALAHYTLGTLQRRLGDLSAARRSFRNVSDLCASRPADEPVHLSDGETAGSLVHAAELQLQMIPP